MSRPAETVGPQDASGPQRGSFRWLLAALGLYVGLFGLLRAAEFLPHEGLGPAPCGAGEALGGSRLAGLLWVGLCLLVAFLGRSFTICFLFSEVAWPGALWRAFKGIWVVVAAGTFLIASMAPGLWGVTEGHHIDVFLLVLVALISGPAQAYLGGLATLRPGLQMLWRHAALSTETGIILLIAILGVLSFAAVCSTLGGFEAGLASNHLALSRRE